MAYDDPLLPALMRLSPPVSTSYFHGQLLTVADFRREQDYQKLRDAMQGRLICGPGILAGLHVTADTSRANHVTFTVAPGVAVDRLGRLIVVPHPDKVAAIRSAEHVLDLTGDDLRKEAQDAVDTTRPPAGPVSLRLDLFVGYDARETDFAPVKAGDCDALRQRAPSALRETYAITHKITVEPTPPRTPDTSNDAIFPSEPAPGIERVGDLRKDYHRAYSDDSPDGLKEDPPRVQIGRLSLTWDRHESPLMLAKTFTTEWAAREDLFTTGDLLKIILRLSRRVDELQRQLLPSCESGDAQQAYPNNELEEPIAVRVRNSKGEDMSRVSVLFRVTGGGGNVGGGPLGWACEHRVDTDANGVAAIHWTLGKRGWLHTVEASVALQQPCHSESRSLGHLVKFTALAIQDLPIPRVVHVTPWQAPNRPDWVSRPDLSIQFSRCMQEDELGDAQGRPDAWLRAWAVTPSVVGAEHVDLRRLKLTFDKATKIRTPSGDQWLARYAVCPSSTDLRRPGTRILVVMWSRNEFIQSREGKELDASFDGTRVGHAGIKNVWDLNALDEHTLALPYGHFVPLGRDLPSGDGSPGGLFHSVFELPDWPRAAQ